MTSSTKAFMETTTTTTSSSATKAVSSMAVTTLAVMALTMCNLAPLSDAAATAAAAAGGDGSRKLLAVDVLYRHGDRTPINPYPNDPYKGPGVWPVGPGQLTSRGKMMHYNLGKYLRSRYKHLLGEKYNETMVRVRSTDVDRTLMSAQSNLAGLFPPIADQVWNPDLAWQPVPVHTVPLEQDDLLSSHAECPRFNQLYAELMESDEIRAIDASNREVYEYASLHSGVKIDNLVQVDYLTDTLFIESLYNLTLPDWTHRVFPQPMRSLQDLSFKLTTWNVELARLRAGPLVKAVYERMKAAAEANERAGGDEDIGGDHKMVMYSAHDTTVAYLLGGLGLFDPPIAPPYASCVMIELFRNEATGNGEIRILFRNETEREPYVLRLCGKNEFCTLREFGERTLAVRPDNWKLECQLREEEEDPVIWMVSVFSFVVSSVILALLVVAVAVSIVRLKKRHHQHRGLKSANNSDYMYSTIESSSSN